MSNLDCKTCGEGTTAWAHGAPNGPAMFSGNVCKSGHVEILDYPPLFSFRRWLTANQDGLVALGGAFAALVVVAGIVAAVTFFASEGRVTYCYVKMGMGSKSCLQGHEEWRMDRGLGCWDTVEAAVSEAKVLGCPLEEMLPPAADVRGAR